MSEATTTIDPVVDAQTKLDEANAKLAEATSAFTTLLTTKGEGMSLDEQLAIPERLTLAKRAVANAESLLKTQQTNAKQRAVNELVNPLHKVLADAIPANLRELMATNELGNVVTFTVQLNETGPAVNHRFAGAKVVAPASADGEKSETTGRTKRIITVDGVDYAPTAYLEKFLPDAIANKTVNWGTVEERLAYKADHSKRAIDLADKLGHAHN